MAIFFHRQPHSFYKTIISITALIITILATASPACAEVPAPKREFRGAWLHVIGQSQYQNMTPARCRQYIDDQMERLAESGCNAVIFQVRPTADAVYKSDIEPWSAWLTGKRGRKPAEDWDPLGYAIEKAHARGMELHAWLNPYRVTSSPKEVLPAEHDSNREPHRFFRYNGQILFNPAYQENRDFICKVVTDILRRYDVDGIHIDDYFYPYPGKLKLTQDADSYAKMGGGKSLADWRRHNVDLLIEQLHNTIKKEKPWVRFGISPFGIWRNKRSDPRGSDTNGLQNYDDLYADILLWDRKGWVDYFVPQLYWNLDLKVAPSRHLARWWNDNIHNSDLYIGHDVKRTMDTPDSGNGHKSELATKVDLSRTLPNVKGNVWWHGYWVTGNYRGAADSLASVHQRSLALPPVYGNSKIVPPSPSNIRITKENGSHILQWDAPGHRQAKQADTDVVKYVVYQFYDGEKADISEPAAIVAVTPMTKMRLPESREGSTWMVTSLDRMNRESAPAAVHHK